VVLAVPAASPGGGLAIEEVRVSDTTLLIGLVSAIPILAATVIALAAIGIARVVRTARGRWVLFAAFVAYEVAGFGVMISQRPTELAPMLFVCFAFASFVAVGVGMALRWRMLRGREVALDGRQLVVRAGDRILGSVDMSRSYTVRIPLLGYGRATYCIEQDGRRVRFCSASRGAPGVVHDALGLDYPPFMRMPGL